MTDLAVDCLDDRDIQAAMRAGADEVRDLDESFRRFHEANPGVFVALVRLARKAKDAGHARISVKMLWEILRWEVLVGDTKLGEGYKLNNNYTSRYARLIAETEPDLEGLFATRRLRS